MLLLFLNYLACLNEWFCGIVELSKTVRACLERVQFKVTGYNLGFRPEFKEVCLVCFGVPDNFCMWGPLYTHCSVISTLPLAWFCTVALVTAIGKAACMM